MRRFVLGLLTVWVAFATNITLPITDLALQNRPLAQSIARAATCDAALIADVQAKKQAAVAAVIKLRTTIASEEEQSKKLIAADIKILPRLGLVKPDQMKEIVEGHLADSQQRIVGTISPTTRTPVNAYFTAVAALGQANCDEYPAAAREYNLQASSFNQLAKRSFPKDQASYTKGLETELPHLPDKYLAALGSGVAAHLKANPSLGEASASSLPENAADLPASLNPNLSDGTTETRALDPDLRVNLTKSCDYCDPNRGDSSSSTSSGFAAGFIESIFTPLCVMSCVILESAFEFYALIATELGSLLQDDNPDANTADDQPADGGAFSFPESESDEPVIKDTGPIIPDLLPGNSPPGISLPELPVPS